MKGCNTKLGNGFRTATKQLLRNFKITKLRGQKREPGEPDNHCILAKFGTQGKILHNLS